MVVLMIVLIALAWFGVVWYVITTNKIDFDLAMSSLGLKRETLDLEIKELQELKKRVEMLEKKQLKVGYTQAVTDMAELIKEATRNKD